MRWLFFLSLLLLTIFEVSRVFYIMPMPGSQQADAVAVSYLLHTWRWTIRLVLGLTALISMRYAIQSSIRLTMLAVFILSAVAVFFNFFLVADRMFLQPEQLLLKHAATNEVDSQRLVLGIVAGDEARCYPIQFIGYHHQVVDVLAGDTIIVTYCNVCRSGRVFEPRVQGKIDQFRLVGMDRFNAMLEDRRTRSWWRQVSGEAVAGPLKGAILPEIPSFQMTHGQWLRLHPGSLIMQPDPAFVGAYAKMDVYESGGSSSHLTMRDTTHPASSERSNYLLEYNRDNGQETRSVLSDDTWLRLVDQLQSESVW